jgi:hypothetical protein
MSLRREFEIIGNCVAKHWLPITTASGAFLQNIHNELRVALPVKNIKAVIGLPNDDMVLILDNPEKNNTQVALAKLTHTADNKLTCQPVSEKTMELSGRYHHSEISYDGQKILFSQLPHEKSDKQNYHLFDTNEFKLSADTPLKSDYHDQSRDKFTLLSSRYIGLKHNNDTIRVFELQSHADKYTYDKDIGSIYFNFTEREELDTTYNVTFSPDGRWLAVCSFSKDESADDKKYFVSIYRPDTHSATAQLCKFETNQPRHAPIWLDDNSLVFIGKDSKSHADVVYRTNVTTPPECITVNRVERLVAAPGFGLILQTSSPKPRVLSFSMQTSLLNTLESTLTTMPSSLHQSINEYAKQQNGTDLTVARAAILNTPDEIYRYYRLGRFDRAMIAARNIPILGSLSFFSTPTQLEKKQEQKMMLDIKCALKNCVANKRDDKSYSQGIEEVLGNFKITETRCDSKLQKLIHQIRALDSLPPADEQRHLGIS